MRLADIERVVAEKRAQVPDAQYAVIVVPKTWPDSRLGSNVRIVGTLTAKYVGPNDTQPGSSIVDLRLADADTWIERKRRTGRKASPVMLRALQLVDESSGHLVPSDFARALWDTAHWVQTAVGRTGAAYLDRLAMMGLITRGYRLTEAGKRVLDKR